jgi:hypothetical protein
MGMALTYARRYWLFSIVGIAGEDDLDALKTTVNGATTDGTAGAYVTGAEASVEHSGRRRGDGKVAQAPMLEAETSAILRERLITECANLLSVDAAVAWAPDALKTRNTLRTEDAEMLERAFVQRLRALEDHEVPALAESDAQTSETGTTREAPVANERNPACSTASGGIAIVGPRRRDKAHLKFVASQTCLVCGRKPSDPHHLRFAQPRALGRKVSDE